ncbi:MAG: SDR family NAD(P)-dependent oxidoreductase [Chloroflexota bacterium]|nr:SDR family NAD(P)-dependent oxidoreductase [Chloroflexota bacterium]
MNATKKTILITGASSGIGYATALAFAAQGWNVVATGRSADRLEVLAAEAAGLPGAVMTRTADVTDPASLHDAVASGLTRFGQLDALLANAGVGQRGAVVDAQWSHLETVLRTNIDGIYHSVRACVPALRQTRGQIVIISSVLATLVAPYYTTYTASKAFSSSMAASLRMELSVDGIGVTDMRVGRTATEFNARRLGSESSEKKKSHRLVPVMSAEFVADRIVRAVERRSKVVYLRLFDRLLAWGGAVAPGLMGRFSRAQYK